MEQIVNHKGYWCKVVHQGWKVRQWKSEKTGQCETLIYPRKLYVPEGDIDDPAVLVNEIDQSGTLVEEERKEAARKAARVRNKAKAKAKCRHTIKTYALRQLATGTYKENMVDFDRARRDFAAFLRLMRRYIPGFRAVYAFERQDRGAWHWHAAIDKLPPFFVHEGVRLRSFDFVRRMWVRVVGRYEGKDNGTVNFDGHNKTKLGTPAKWTGNQSLALIAGYVSKYLTKDTEEGIEGRNMWGRTQGITAEKPVTMEFSEPCSLADVIRLAFAVPEGHRIVQHACWGFGKFWRLYTEPDPDYVVP